MIGVMCLPPPPPWPPQADTFFKLLTSNRWKEYGCYLKDPTARYIHSEWFVMLSVFLSSGQITPQLDVQIKLAKQCSERIL